MDDEDAAAHLILDGLQFGNELAHPFAAVLINTWGTGCEGVDAQNAVRQQVLPENIDQRLSVGRPYKTDRASFDKADSIDRPILALERHNSLRYAVRPLARHVRHWRCSNPVSQPDPTERNIG